MYDDATALPQDAGALVDHLLRHHHEVHRADLAALLAPARWGSGPGSAGDAHAPRARLPPGCRPDPEPRVPGQDLSAPS